MWKNGNTEKNHAPIHAGIRLHPAMQKGKNAGNHVLKSTRQKGPKG